MYSGSRAAANSRTAAAAPPPPSSAAGRDHVGHQPLVPGRVLPRHHHRLRHPRVGGQHRLDLTRLDPEPPHLHLVISPAHEHQHPVRRATAPDPPSGTSAPPPAPGTGQPRTAPPSAPHRPRYPRASPAPATYNSPATPAGTGHSHSSSTNTRVFATGRPIGTSTSDVGAGPRGASPPWSRSGRTCCAGSRRSSRASRAASRSGSASPLQITRRRLPQAAEVSLGEEPLQHRRHELHRGDAGRTDQPGQVRRVPMPARPGQHQRRTRQAAARTAPRPTHRSSRESSAAPGHRPRARTRPASRPAGSRSRPG